MTSRLWLARSVCRSGTGSSDAACRGPVPRGCARSRSCCRWRAGAPGRRLTRGSRTLSGAVARWVRRGRGTRRWCVWGRRGRAGVWCGLAALGTLGWRDTCWRRCWRLRCRWWAFRSGKRTSGSHRGAAPLATEYKKRFKYFCWGTKKPTKWVGIILPEYPTFYTGY